MWQAAHGELPGAGMWGTAEPGLSGVGCQQAAAEAKKPACRGWEMGVPRVGRHLASPGQ